MTTHVIHREIYSNVRDIEAKKPRKVVTDLGFTPMTESECRTVARKLAQYPLWVYRIVPVNSGV